MEQAPTPTEPTTILPRTISAVVLIFVCMCLWGLAFMLMMTHGVPAYLPLAVLLFSFVVLGGLALIFMRKPSNPTPRYSATEQPLASQQLADTAAQVEQQRRTNKKQLVWGIACIMLPVTLFAIATLGSVVMGSVASSYLSSITQQDSGALEPSPIYIIASMVISLIQIVGFIGLLPGIIGGIILIRHSQKNLAPPL